MAESYGKIFAHQPIQFFLLAEQEERRTQLPRLPESQG